VNAGLNSSGRVVVPASIISKSTMGTTEAINNSAADEQSSNHSSDALKSNTGTVWFV
jgi:hypothetical protein